MNHRKSIAAVMAGLMVCWGVCPGMLGCAGTAAEQDAVTDQAVVEEAPDEAGIADGVYQIEVDTDSSMFHAESCLLKVEDGTYTAILSLPGEGFSRLYWGTADEAASAADADIYEYYLNDEGNYTFELPVSALDEELPIAAFGHRRDRWYDHLITFHAPTGESLADAA